MHTKSKSIEAEVNGMITKLPKEFVPLKVLSEVFSIPMWTLYSYVNKRRFPGIIKLGSRIYVDLKRFRSWFLQHEVKTREYSRNIEGGGKDD